MNAWPVCVSVTQGIDQNFWCYGTKANTKGNTISINMSMCRKEVQVGKDQEKAQSEKDSHSKNQGGKKPN